MRVKPAESPIMRVCKVLFSATSGKMKHKHAGSRSQAALRANRSSYAWLEEACDDGSANDANGVNGGIATGVPAGVPGGGVPGLHPDVVASSSPQSKKGPKHYTHEQVEEVRLVVRLFPMFLATCFYWTIYSQMQTLFVSQGMLMNTDVKFKRFGLDLDLSVPPASLSFFDTISIIVLIPLYDRGLAPLLKYLGLNFTVLKVRSILFSTTPHSTLPLLPASLSVAWPETFIHQEQVGSGSSMVKWKMRI